jgi:hypothetical protein
MAGSLKYTAAGQFRLTSLCDFARAIDQNRSVRPNFAFAATTRRKFRHESMAYSRPLHFLPRIFDGCLGCYSLVMKFSDAGKEAIIASIASSPLLLEVLKTVPVKSWDEPKEIANAIVQTARAIIAEAERSIP